MTTTIIGILTPKPLAPSSGLVGSEHHIDWHYLPESFQQNSTVTTVGTDGDLGTKKMGLVGEFKFFSEFGCSETGETPWKQTKAGNRNHQLKLFQKDCSVFFSQQSAQ